MTMDHRGRLAHPIDLNFSFQSALCPFRGQPWNLLQLALPVNLFGQKSSCLLDSLTLAQVVPGLGERDSQLTRARSALQARDLRS